AQPRGNSDFADGGAFHRFRGVVNQIDEHAAKQLRVGPDLWEARREVRADSHAVQTAGKDFEGGGDDAIQVYGHERGLRETGHAGKRVHEVAQRGNFALDQPGTFRDERFELAGGFRAGRGALSAAVEEALEALGRKLDRRERVFDF